MNQHHCTLDRVRSDQCYVIQNLLINRRDCFYLNHFDFLRSKEVRLDRRRFHRVVQLN